MATFQDKPLAGDLLSNSQADLKGNFDYLQGVIGGAPPVGSPAAGKDHQMQFGSTDSTPAEGRHNRVGFIDLGAQTFPIDGLTGVEYASAGNLYFINSTIGPIQLTKMGVGNVSNSATNGSTFLPGGMIMKWGAFTIASGSTQAVTFTQAFPTACFTVYLQQQSNNTASTTSQVTINSAAQFTAQNIKANTYYWFAIGN